MRINKKYFLFSMLLTWLVGSGLSLVFTPNLIMSVVESRMKEEAGVNSLKNRYTLNTDLDRDVVRPNNDTLYSIAWLDLAGQPLVLSVPAMGERYFAFQFLGMDTSVIDVVGSRTLGESPSRVLIADSDSTRCEGEFDAVVNLHGSSSWLLGRTLVDGESDLESVKRVMEGYRLEKAKNCLLN